MISEHFLLKRCSADRQQVSEYWAPFYRKVLSVPRTYRATTNLDKLQFSPTTNPLLRPQAVEMEHRLVRSGRSEDLIDPIIDKAIGIAAIHQVEEYDDTEYEKALAIGVAANYELTKTAQRVFRLAREELQRSNAIGGHSPDSVELFWFDAGLAGRDVGMSEYTFKRGLRELIDKKFLYPRMPGIFWINPTLFFTSDRVRFIREYRRKPSGS